MIKDVEHLLTNVSLGLWSGHTNYTMASLSKHYFRTKTKPTKRGHSGYQKKKKKINFEQKAVVEVEFT